MMTVNPLTPNDPYRGRTAPLNSKRCILYIYSTNIVTEYFKHGLYSSFFSLKNAVPVLWYRIVSSEVMIPNLTFCHWIHVAF